MHHCTCISLPTGILQRTVSVVMKGEVKIVHVLREELKLISAFDDPQALIAASNQGEVEILRDFLVRNPSTVSAFVLIWYCMYVLQVVLRSCVCEMHIVSW